MRIAAAPISWGVCEVADWGHQMAAERVLDEMAVLGFTAAELGPDGFLPEDPDDVTSMLDRHGLRLAAGFVPVMLHDRHRWEEERARAVSRIEHLAAAGADVAVVAAATGGEGYESSVVLDDKEWHHLSSALGELEEAARARRVVLALHPHHGTVVESPGQIERLMLESEVGLCLDTGHVMVGGGDPVALSRAAADRIAHVHLKDVDSALATRVSDGQVGYRAAVGSGLFPPLGAGDMDLGGVLDALQAGGFEGWLVLEQDLVLTGEPATGSGPAQLAAASLAYLEDRISAP